MMRSTFSMLCVALIAGCGAEPTCTVPPMGGGAALSATVVSPWSAAEVTGTTLDVTSYGADPTGITSSTAAVLAAYAAVTSGDLVRWPLGVYQLDAMPSLVVPDGVATDLDGSYIVAALATDDGVLFDMGSDTALVSGTLAVAPPTRRERYADRGVPILVGRYLWGDGRYVRRRVRLERLTIQGGQQPDNSSGVALMGDVADIAIRDLYVDGGGQVSRGIIAHWSRDGSTVYHPRPVQTRHPGHILIDGLTTRSLRYTGNPLANVPVLFSASHSSTVRRVDRGHRPHDVVLYPGDFDNQYAGPLAPVVNTNYAWDDGVAVTCAPQWEDVP